ncbi:MAG: GreA/GreB family elongation factor [Verrucomicrobiota bacterium]
MELRADDVDPAEAMARDVVEATDLKLKAKAVESIMKNADVFEDIGVLKPVVEDLNQSASKSVRLMLSQALELILCRMDLQAQFDGLELGEEQLDLATVLQEERENLNDTLRTLGVARQRQVLEAFPQAFGDEYVGVVLGMLNESGMRGIGELTKFLFDKEKGEDLTTYLRKGLQQRAVHSDVLTWICKERSERSAGLIDNDLPAVIMANLERDFLGEGGRRSNRLSEIMQSDAELIPDLIKDASLNQVRGFVRRIKMSPAFDQLSSNSLLARVIKIHPEVQDMVLEGEGGGVAKDDSLVVSWESLEARQKELENLINVLQPKNREEIKIAREYGDLRENFEYKAAKDQEKVLRRQREEMEQDLARARGTDFADADTSRASIGTIVTLEDTKSKEEETFTILGAWDSDPDKRVIAYTTGAGVALLGKKEGETADLPTDVPEQTRKVMVTKIEAYKAAAKA